MTTISILKKVKKRKLKLIYINMLMFYIKKYGWVNFNLLEFLNYPSGTIIRKI